MSDARTAIELASESLEQADATEGEERDHHIHVAQAEAQIAVAVGLQDISSVLEGILARMPYKGVS
jgi:hypothetical protein